MLQLQDDFMIAINTKDDHVRTFADSPTICSKNFHGIASVAKEQTLPIIIVNRKVWRYIGCVWNMLHIYLVLSCQWTERKEDYYGEGTCQDVDDEGSKNDTLLSMVAKKEEDWLLSKKWKPIVGAEAAELSGHGTSKACLLHPAIFTLEQFKKDYWSHSLKISLKTALSSLGS